MLGQAEQVCITDVGTVQEGQQVEQGEPRDKSIVAIGTEYGERTGTIKLRLNSRLSDQCLLVNVRAAFDTCGTAVEVLDMFPGWDDFFLEVIHFVLLHGAWEVSEAEEEL